jgi:hypothetical protein
MEARTRCSWPADDSGEPSILLREPPADDAEPGPPSDCIPLTLRQPASGGAFELSVQFSSARAWQRLTVVSSARTLELHAAHSADGTPEFVGSSRGEDVGAGLYSCSLAACSSTPASARLELKLLSIKPAGVLTLRSVVLELAEACAEQSAAQPVPHAAQGAMLLGMLARAMGGARQLGGAAAPSAASRVEALEAAGNALPSAGHPAAPSAPMVSGDASLETRITALEAQMVDALAAISRQDARLAALESAVNGPDPTS